MKIGFYDSGLGGISIFREFIRQDLSLNFVADQDSVDLLYFGDSARAPYGDRSREELVRFVYEIFDFMQEQQVDIVISACNTSSMFLDQIDLSKYDFKIYSLNNLMRDFFATNDFADEILFLATEASVRSARYREWNAQIEARACPELVPLLEAGDLDRAQQIFADYCVEAETVIIGCSHYGFLYQNNSYIRKEINFIDPAKILIQKLKAGNSVEPQNQLAQVEIYTSGNQDKFRAQLQSLAGLDLPVQYIDLNSKIC